MSEYRWTEWGRTPTDSAVRYARDFRCRNCNKELLIESSEWIEHIEGYSPHVPNPPGVAPEDINKEHDGGIVVQCSCCQTLSWWHIKKMYMPDYLLDLCPKWPKL